MNWRTSMFTASSLRLKFASKARLDIARDCGKHAVSPIRGIKRSRAGGQNQPSSTCEDARDAERIFGSAHSARRGRPQRGAGERARRASLRRCARCAHRRQFPRCARSSRHRAAPRSPRSPTASSRRRTRSIRSCERPRAPRDLDDLVPRTQRSGALGLACLVCVWAAS